LFSGKISAGSKLDIPVLGEVLKKNGNFTGKRIKTKKPIAQQKIPFIQE
jgi:hypothetical protein